MILILLSLRDILGDLEPLSKGIRFHLGQLSIMLTLYIHFIYYLGLPDSSPTSLALKLLLAGFACSHEGYRLAETGLQGLQKGSRF